VTQRKMLDGEIQVELVPQGTLAERIRAGGAGLGGVLTPTGVGTLVVEGKRAVEVGGREFLLEPPLHADFALVHAHEADYLFNSSTASPRRTSTHHGARSRLRHRLARRDRAARRDSARCGPHFRCPRVPSGGEEALTMEAKELIARRVAVR
jgi:Coenzyme A transferase